MRGPSSHSTRRLQAPRWLFLLGAATLLFSSWLGGREARMVAAWPQDAQAAIYDRELASIRTLCAGPRTPAVVQQRCREKADFIAEFPECDAGCRAVVEPFKTHPTR